MVIVYEHSVIQLYSGVPLIAEQLNASNYTSHYVGKWHGGFCSNKLTPTQRGFESFYGFYTAWGSKFRSPNIDFKFVIFNPKQALYTTVIISIPSQEDFLVMTTEALNLKKAKIKRQFYTKKRAHTPLPILQM